MNTTITRSTPVSRIAGNLALLLIGVLVVAPWWGSSATLYLIGEICIYIALASLWNLLAGYTGLVSVGQQAFVGLGGYLLFIVTLPSTLIPQSGGIHPPFLGLHPLLAIPIAGMVAAVIAIPIGKLVFRLQGAYFAIGTWVVAEVMRLSFAQITDLGGGSGYSLPVQTVKLLGATKVIRDSSIYWLSLTLGIGSVALVYILLRSKIGLALTAIRDSEIASSSLGVKIETVKYGVYIAVAAMTAMIGTIIFLQKLRISPDAAFGVNDWTAFVIFIVVIGGIGTIEGPIIGTLVYFGLREYLADLGSIYLMILGALAIVIMLVAPKGIWGYISKRFSISLFPVGHHIHFKD